MAMTPSQLSIIVQSKGIKEATTDLTNLAKAASSVDAETKAFVIAQQKLAESNNKVSKTSEATARGVTAQELALIKAHTAANKMNDAMVAASIKQQLMADGKLAKELERQAAASERAAKAAEAHERGMVKQHIQALKMNDAFDKHAKGLDEVSRRGNVYVNTLRSMATAALAYVGVNFFTNIVKQADAWSMMQSKLSLAVGGMEVAVNVQHSLFEMAQRLRVPLEDSVKLFTRMAVPLQKMGLGVKDTQTVVESFSTALKLAGATGQEASSAMLQFSQSINAGRLNGGEFNSIAEASPNVLRAIEAELIRTGRGAELTAKGLKEMAAAGKLTTDVLVNALKNAAPQWKKDFDSLPLTVDGALQRIKNSWLKIIGDLGKDTKFNEKMADAVKKLEALMPPLAEAIVTTFTLIVDHGAKVVAALTSILGVMALFKAAVFIQPFLNAAIAAGTLAGALGQVKLAMLALGITPVGLALTALAGTVAAVAYNWDSLTKSVSKVNDVNNQTLTTSGEIVKGIHSENTALEAQIDKLRRANGEQEKYNSTKLEGMNTGSQADLEQLNRGLKVLERNLVDAEKASKSAYNLSSFDPSKIAKISKANTDVAETRMAIESQQREIILATAGLEKMKRLTLERDEKQREKDMRDRVTTIYENARSERQIVEDDFKQKRTLAKESYEKLKYDKFYHQQEMANIERDYQEALSRIKGGKSSKEASGMFLNQGKDDLFAETDKRIEEFAKAQEKTRKLSEDRLAATTQELAETNALIEGYSRKKEALIDLEITQEEAKLKALDKNLVDKAEVENIKKNIEELNKLKAAKAKLGELDALAKQSDSNKKILADMWDTTKVDKFETASSKALKGMAKGFVEVTKALGKYGAAKATIEARTKANNEEYDTQKISDIEYLKNKSKIEQDSAEYQLAAYASTADAAKNFFDEGSKGYKTLDGISKVVHAAQMARNLIEMGQLAVKAVMNQAGGDPYSAWLRMGAMAAAMAALGFAVGGGFNSNSGGMKAADVQKTQGTGSVFGDPEAKSGSISNSLELLKRSYDKLYPVNQGMLKALKNIESSMSGLSNLVLRSGGVIEGTNMGIQEGTIAKSGMSWGMATILGGITAPIVKWISGLWGKTTQNIVDSGIQFGGSLSGMQSGQGFNQYASVDTTKSSWFGLKKSTTNTVQTQGLSNELSSQLGLVFTNMQKSLEEAGKALYGSSEGVTKALDSLVISTSKISLKGLSGDALTNAINAVISKGLDEMAQAAFANFDQYRQVGEGYAQTIMRVANNFVTVNATFSKLGMKLLDTSDAGIKASDSFIKLFDSLEDMQSVASEYYDKFYTEQEKQEKITGALKKQFTEMNSVLPDSVKAYRALVDSTTDPEKLATLWKLSSAFYEVFGSIENGAKEIPQQMKDMFDKLSKDTDRWYNLRSQASSLKDSVSSAMGNPQKDPAIRIKQLWDAMATDVSPEQKMQLAGELKDLVLAKYQVEKDSMQKLIDFGKQLRSYVESLKLGALSPMTVGQKLAEAKRQYDETLAKAQGGDTTAQGNLQGKAESYLQLAQTAFASSSEYVGIFNSVTGSLDSLGMESLTAAEVAQNTANSQLLELQKLYEFATTVETTANNYYNASVLELTKQTLIMDATYKQLGVLNGMTEVLSTLPAEIAAAVSGGLFVTKLYETLAGKTGSEIDTTGMEYWLKEVGLYGREYVLKAFQDAVAKAPITSPIVAIKPTDTTTVLQETVVALKEEIAALRDDQNKQTEALIAATVIANQQNASEVVEGVDDAFNKKNWKEVNAPALV